MKQTTHRELLISVLSFIGLAMAWNAYDYGADMFGGDALAATGARTASLSVSVAQSITLTQVIGSAVTFGAVTPGTPVGGKTGLQVSTNGGGMNITAGRKRAITGVTLASSAAPSVAANQISDTAGGIDVFNGLANCNTATSTSAVWATGTSTGLGFSNYGFTGGTAKSACWGTGTTSTDANNRYAALQASGSASSFISSSGFSGVPTVVSVAYRLDVPATQRATSYDGGVVYTVTSNP